MGHVAQTEADGDEIEVVIGKGQRFGIGLHIADIPDQPLVTQLVAAHLEHGVVDIGQDHLALLADDTGEAGGQVASATSQIQYLLSRPDAGALYGKALPEPVNAKGHQIIHQIIFGGHRVEYIGHQLLFFLGVDRLVAKVGGFIAHSRSRVPVQFDGAV